VCIVGCITNPVRLIITYELTCIWFDTSWAT
jgi:hypothetical protein